MARYAVIIRGAKDNSEAGKKAFLDKFATSYRISAEEARNTINQKKGEVYGFDDYEKAKKASKFLEGIGGIPVIRDNIEGITPAPPPGQLPPDIPPEVDYPDTSYSYQANTPNTPQVENCQTAAAPQSQMPDDAQPAPAQEAALQMQTPEAAPAQKSGQMYDPALVQVSNVPVRTVFRPLEVIRFPDRCLGCFCERPVDSLTISAMPATAASSGTTAGAIGGGFVGALVGGVVGSAIAAGKGHQQFFKAPICAPCSARLSKKERKQLAGSGDGAIFGNYKVDTPFLTREIIKKCMVLTFYNNLYGEEFKKANSLYVHDTVDACKASKSPGQSLTENSMDLYMTTILGDQPFPAIAVDSPEFQEKVVQILRACIRDNNLYMYDNIPQKKLVNASAADNVPSTERILALIDCTIMGSAKNNLLVCTEGIYFHNDKLFDGPAVGHIKYKTFPDKSFLGGGNNEVLFGENSKLDISGAMIKKQEVITILRGIRHLLVGYDPAAIKQPVAVTQNTGTIYAPGTPEFNGKLKEAVQRHISDNGIYLAGSIPPKKLNNAMKTCQVPNGERVMALIDLTAMGSAKNALLFGTLAIYYHNDWTSESSGAGTIPYADFANRIFDCGGYQEVNMGMGACLNVAAGAVSPDDVKSMLFAVKELVTGTA